MRDLSSSSAVRVLATSRNAGAGEREYSTAFCADCFPLQDLEAAISDWTWLRDIRSPSSTRVRILLRTAGGVLFERSRRSVDGTISATSLVFDSASRASFIKSCAVLILNSHAVSTHLRNTPCG